MRFERLDLAPYGRFADRRLEFSPDATLHIVLGLNEAGKSTTLEAIKDFLFRIESRTPYGFEHGYDAMRIGASLRFADGALLQARRRKGNVNTFVDDANKPVSDERLVQALAGLDRKAFEAEYGLSQSSLRAGGAELLKAGGQLAETLAAGSAGLGPLVKMRERLDAEAVELFTPRRSKGKAFYEAYDAYEKAEKALREAIVTAEALRKAEQRRVDALNAEQRLREEQEEAGRSLALRQRAGRTHPTLARLDAIALNLNAFPDLPEIDAGALASARKALDEDRALRATIAQLAAEGEAENRDIAARVVDRALLDEGPAIEALREKLGAVREAKEDRPRRVEARMQATHQLDDLARRLGLPGHCAMLAAAPSDAEIAIARVALDSRRAAARRREEAQARLGEAMRKCELMERAVGPVPVLDPEPLRRRLDALAERVADAKRLHEEENALNARAQNLAEFAARLDPPVVDLDALARAPLPDAADVAAFAKVDEARAKAEEIAVRDADRAAGELEAATASRDTLELEAAGSTRADWLAARGARERGLDRLGATLDSAAAARRNAFDQARALALAADAIGDRYFEDVERATRLQTAREECAARSADLARARTLAERCATEREVARAEWQTLWERSGFAPLAPAAMTRWLDRAEALLKSRTELASFRASITSLGASVAEAHASLTELFVGPAGFETAYREARTELSARQAAFDAAVRAEQARAQAAGAKRAAAEEVEAREGELASLVADWATAMQALRLKEDAPAEAAEAALAAWAAVGAPRTLMERETRSVEGIERFLNRFADDVQALARRLAPEHTQEAPENAISIMVNRLTNARRVAAERTQLETSAERRAARFSAEEAKRQALNPTLAAARARTGAADNERLALALERCEARRDLETERMQALRVLVEAGDGVGETQLRAESQGLDLTILDDEIVDLRQRREALDAARRDAARAARDAEADYEALARGRDAAGAARRRAEAADEILEVAERWLIRAAAARLAGRAIERHRDAAQDPAIARAGALFAIATAGSFASLAIGYDKADQPILVARRPNDRTVEVAGLSEGARDQLYLALRLALLERRAGEPLPFVGDDLLASFDDERARHTLELLAAAGAKRQTILFTHHARIAELSKGLPGAEVLEI